MAEQQNRPQLPVSADQIILAGGGTLMGVIANVAAHSNGTVGLLVGGTAAAVSLMLVPKELRLKKIKSYIPSFYAGDDADRESTRLERGRPSTIHDDDDELRRPVALPRGMFTLSQVLKDFTPSLDKIYLGQLEDGSPVFCRAKDLCHVALTGATGNGKSSIMRMLMAQLCYAGAKVLYLNPHFTWFDRESEMPEDWTPFESYLFQDPMECRKTSVIGQYLEQIATELLPKRLDKYARSIPLGKPYFIVIDEIPSIMAELPNAAKHLGKILREGRKVGIYLITASQDFLVRTIDPSGKNGGAVRQCFRTAYYTGGDQTTANTLLDLKGKPLPETTMGKGVAMLRNDPAVKIATVVRVPYTDNEALYVLLGPSTYVDATLNVIDDELHQPGEVQTENLNPSLMDEFNQMYQKQYGQQPESDTEDPIPSTRMAPLPMRVPETPVLPDKGRLADDLPMGAVIALWNANEGKMSINQLWETWGLATRTQAEKLRKKILEQAQAAQPAAQSEDEE